MKSFANLKEGDVITNPKDGDMVVHYSNYFRDDDKKELCFLTEKCIWAGGEFEPNDWEMKCNVKNVWNYFN